MWCHTWTEGDTHARTANGAGQLLLAKIGHRHGANASQGCCAVKDSGDELTKLNLVLRELAGIWNDIVQVEGDVLWNGNAHLHNFWYSICHNVDCLREYTSLSEADAVCPCALHCLWSPVEHQVCHAEESLSDMRLRLLIQ